MGSSGSDSAPSNGGKLSIGSAVATAAWAVASEVLLGPSILRTSELLTGSTDAVVPSDFLLTALALKTCPLGPIPPNPLTAVGGLAALAWLGYQSAGKRRQQRQLVAAQAVRVEGAEAGDFVWRSAQCPGGELVPSVYPNIKTLYHNFFNLACNNFAQKPCLGTRTSDGYEWETYERVGRRATLFGSGLVSLGVAPEQKVGIYSVNNAQWVVAELACYAYGFVNVALYSTLGQAAVDFVVGHSEMVAAVCSPDALDALLDALPSCPLLKLLVVMDASGLPATPDQIARAEGRGVEILSFAEVEIAGANQEVPHRPPQPSDLATIMYTSGTTGNPKGVMLTHANVIANGVSYPLHFKRFLPSRSDDLSPGDRYLSYLPLAHIFERSMLAVMFAQGVAVGFYGGRPEALIDDIAALKPTLLAGVPRVFNRVHDKVVQKISSGSAVARFLFNQALKESLRVRRAGGASGSLPLWDLLVFRKIKARLGGSCKIIVSGGAPLSAEVQEFLMAAVGFCIQGYGLTETSAAGAIAYLSDVSGGHVGAPSPSIEIKLEAVEEMRYFPTDTPNPRGEVCIRGHAIMKGYYKAPELTAEVVDSDGWFHTGDVGQINSNGTLSIIDRKKNIFKLAQGEYIAAEKLEIQYQAAKSVSQIFVYGDSFQSVLVAIVVPEEDELRNWATSKGHAAGPTASLADIISLPGAAKMVLDDLQKQAKASGMKGFEVIKEVALESEPFAVENDLLTPTFKLRRPQLKAKYKETIDELYRKWSK